MRSIWTIATFFVLSGCVSHAPSVPEGYTGETATIDDSFKRTGRTKAQLYFVKLIDGKEINNAMAATDAATFGKGPEIQLVGASREIRAQPQKLYIVGRIHHGPPIGYVINAGENYIVEGEIAFAPDAGKKYLVNGQLSEAYSAVWIEDVNGNIVSELVEKKGENFDESTLIKPETNNKVLSREELYLNIASGESVELVVEKLGKPDGISNYDGNAFTGKPSHVIYRYDGLGNIQFSGRKSEAKFVIALMPVAKNDGDISTIKAQLESDGQSFQLLAQGYYKLDNISDDVLDLFAGKIWEGKASEDPYMIDGLAWLCRTLGKSNNPRYRSLLTDVSETAGSGKLRRYAKVGLKLLPAENVEQFRPTPL